MSIEQAADAAPAGLTVPAPELSVPTAPADAPAVPPVEGAVEGEAAPDGPAEGSKAENDEEKRTRKRSAQERIDQITARWHDAVREIAVKNARIRELERPLVDDSRRAELDPYQEQSLSVREAVRAERAEELRAEMQEGARSALDLQAAQFYARVDATRDQYPDFDAVFDAYVPLSPQMESLLAQSENGPGLAYYLGKNRDQAQSIANMPPQLQGYHLAQIESRLRAAPTVRKATTAPPPVPIVSGAAAAGVKTPDQMSAGDFAEWWKKRGHR